MILNSIGTSEKLYSVKVEMVKKLIIITAMLLTLSCIAVLPSKGSEPESPLPVITWKCHEQHICDVFARTTEGKRITVFHGFVLSPGFRQYGTQLAEFNMSCGSPCNTSIFVDLTKGRVSSLYPNVVAVDARRHLVATATWPTVQVMRIFDKHVSISINREFSPVAALVSAVESATFTATGELILKYLRGPRYESTEERIAVDPKFFGDIDN